MSIKSSGKIEVVAAAQSWCCGLMQASTSAALTTVALLALSASLQAGPLVGMAQIVDGDGLRIGDVAIRLHSIDAPEIDQPCAKRGGGTWHCGVVAAELLAKLVSSKTVECEEIDRDPYERVVARCWAGSVDLWAAMVESGRAWVFRRYSDDYIAEEATAIAAGVGVWQAETIPPWDYRAGQWSEAETPNAECPIKGNINRDGEKIYHVPWSPSYARTRIAEEKGERWFCDEAEAQNAGWRRALLR